MVTWLRKAILAAALFAGLAPVLAQVPPPVPGLPDTERRTSYSISASTCSCSVGFALFGDGVDYQNWIEVFVNGVQVQYNDPVFGWTVTSPTGPLATIPRPVTDAVLTFNNAQTAAIQIVGARRPRRVSQFNENTGVPARNLNQALTDIVAQNRETWDKINDVTGRAIVAPPGETLNTLPPKANRQSQGACFDSGGNLTVCGSIGSTTIAAGNGIAFTGTNPTTISNNIQAGAGISVTGTNPLVIASTSAAAVNSFNPFNYGAVGDGSSHPLSNYYGTLAAAQAVYPFATSLTNEIDWAALQLAVNKAGGATNTNGPKGQVVCPAGFTFVTNMTLTLNIPIAVECMSWINFTPTTGTAIAQMTSSPTKGFENFDLHFYGLNAVNGNAGQPVSINGSGTIGIQINYLWFSNLVIDNIFGFTKYGLYCDGTGDVISAAGGGAQHNFITIRQAPNNGVGIKFESANAATTSCEGNTVTTGDIFQSYDDIELDTTNHTGATTSNTFDIQSIDNAANKGIDVWGSYNLFKIGNIGTSIAFNSTSSFNSCVIGNNFSTDLTIAYGGTNNWCSAAAPNSFPTSQTIVSGMAYQNGYGPQVSVCFTVSITGATGSGTTGSTIKIGATSTPSITIATPLINTATSPVNTEIPVCFTVPPGWYWSATTSLGSGGSPSVSYTPAQIYQAGQ